MRISKLLLHTENTIRQPSLLQNILEGKPKICFTFAKKNRMFHFLKSKPKLPELIPNDFVDIHSHVLSGIDDGAKTMEDSNYLMKQMQNFGFHKSIATPHTLTNIWNNTPEIINYTLEKTKKELPELTNQLDLKAASEYIIDEHFVTLFAEKKLLTLKDKMVLVEMSYINPPIQLFDVLFDMQVAGYVPVLAHPERYLFYHNNFDQYKKLKKAGCYFQLNLLSTVGYYGKHVATTADKLLKNGMIDFVGSDFHHKNHTDSFAKNTILIKEIPALKKAIENNRFFL